MPIETSSAPRDPYPYPVTDAADIAVDTGKTAHPEATTPPPDKTVAAEPGRAWVHNLVSRYALVGVWIALTVVYLVLMPNKFGNVTSFQSIFGSQQLLVFLSMAALATLIVGEFDLSIASLMGLGATLIPVLNTQQGMSLGLSCLIAVAATTACGAVNAFFVVKLGVPSLVVTLGSGSLLLGISMLLADSGVVAAQPSATFRNLTQWYVLGMPVSFWYGLVAMAVFAYICAFTPLGRHLLFVGANREVARLAGIRVDRIRAGSYVTAGFLCGIAAVVLISSVGGFDPTSGGTYLLPTLAAVFLSTAVVLPGQFNPIGTLIGIYFLATGIFGLQLLGLSGWVQDAFYGGGLVFAVTLATLVRTHAKTA